MPELSPDPWFLARSALLCLLVLAPFGAYALLVRPRFEVLRARPLLLEPMAYLFLATAGVVIAKTGAIIALGPRLYQMPFLHETIVGSQTTRILTSGYLANLAFVAPSVLALALLARGHRRQDTPPVSPAGGGLRRRAERGLRAPGLPMILALALGIALAVLLYFVLFDLDIGSLRELSAKRFLSENKEANPSRFYSLRYALFKFAGLPKIVCVVALASYLFVSRRRSLRTLAVLAIVTFFLYGILFSVRAHILLFALETSVLLALARPRRWRLGVATLVASALLVCGSMTVLRMRPHQSDFFATAVRQPQPDAAKVPPGSITPWPATPDESSTPDAEAAVSGEAESEAQPTTPRRPRRARARQGRPPDAAPVATTVYNVAVRVSSLRYFSDISKLAVIIDRWDAEHPFLYGETFYSWVTLPLGDTPLLTFAELGRLLGERVFRHARSGVTPGFIGELYVNFSWLGIMAGGLLVGALAWRFEVWTDRGLASPLAAALLSLSIVKLFLLLLNGTLGSTVLNLALELSLVALVALLASSFGSGSSTADPSTAT